LGYYIHINIISESKSTVLLNTLDSKQVLGECRDWARHFQ